MKYWVITDTHIGHSAIQKHTRRPENVDYLIKRNWKAIVEPDDLVLHLGDVCFGFVKLIDWLSDVPGHKILVRGNHDSHSVSWYMRNGFEYACDGLVMSNVWFTHRPSEIVPKEAETGINVHGHIHNRVPRGWRKYPHCRLLALEYENFTPRIISKFIASIEKETVVTPQDLILAEDVEKNI
jgi:calcineurin-like phosphoesterase family protein